MRSFIALMQWEARQMWRGLQGLWLCLAGIVLGIGLAFVGDDRFFDIFLPKDSYPLLFTIFPLVSIALGLIVAVITAEYWARDQYDQFDEILATMPLATPLYAQAKFLIALSMGLLVAACLLMGLLLAEIGFYIGGSQLYDSLHPGRYLLLWAAICLPSLITASGVSFAGTVLAGGRRVIFYVLFFALWLFPMTAAVSYSDVTGLNYERNIVSPYYGQVERQMASEAGAPIAAGERHDVPSFSLQSSMSRIIHAIDVLPPHLDTFFEMQGLYVLIALACNCIGMLGFRRFRLHRSQ